MFASSVLLDEQGRRVERAGHSRLVGARPVLNETKAEILAAMKALDRPVSSGELHAILGGNRSLQVIEYHLCTLVKANAAKVVLGPCHRSLLFLA